MSKEVVQEVINKVAKDKAFRDLLKNDPDQALKDYKNKLTDDEVESLKAIKPEVLEGFVAVLESEKSKSPWIPSSFKEMGGTALTIVLLGIVIWSVWHTFNLLNTTPTTYSVGETNPIIKEIDAFQRAKDLLNIFFPLISALTTFWLGSAVSSQQVQQQQQQVQEAQTNAQIATNNSIRARVNAAQALGAFSASQSIAGDAFAAESESSKQKLLDLLNKAVNP